MHGCQNIYVMVYVIQKPSHSRQTRARHLLFEEEGYEWD